MPVLTSAPRLRPAALTALALVALLAVPTAAQAAPTHHPAHARTASAPAQRHVTHPITTTTVPASPSLGFGGGTIFAPADTGRAVLGSVIVTPGFTDTQAGMRWYGTDLAAEGFVVLTIDTLDPDRYDTPDARATQMLAAADYLTGESAVRSVVSKDRVGLLGFSMGGGGVLQAAQSRPSIKAAVALMPFDFSSDPDGGAPGYPRLTTPALVVSAQKDDLADPTLMVKPMYDSIPKGTPKQYLQLRGAGHQAGQNTPNGTIRVAATAFLKRYLDGNGAYGKFICPAPAVTPTGPISESTSTCDGPRRR